MKTNALPSSPPSRYFTLWLPDWSTDRLKGHAPGGTGAPTVLYEKSKSALRITAADEKARALGLYEGQPLADARAIEPKLLAAPAKAEDDARAFRRLAEWLTRYSPFVGIYEPGDAFADITGCAHLFGGEDALYKDVLGRFAAAGIAAKAAIADSPGAAYALAHYGGGGIIAPGEAKTALARLPVAALRLESEAAEALTRLGLKAIGQLYGLPRAPIAARLGKTILKRLAEALGEEREPISPLLPAPVFQSEVRLAEPIQSTDALFFCLEKLAPDLEAKLEREGRGGRRFELALFRVDNHVARIEARMARPARKAGHLIRLFKTRLEDIHDEREAGFGYDLLRLSAFDCERCETGETADFDAPKSAGDLHALLDRLANRLGAARVCVIRLEDSHLPERAQRFLPTMTAGAISPRDDNPPPRPLKLLAKPEPIEAVAEVPDGAPLRFIWRRIPYAVMRASGPERIADEWRRREAPRPTRDYYRVEDTRGRRFWIFRKGLYGEDARPQWFLHGFFG